jgi:hypothetical protein
MVAEEKPTTRCGAGEGGLTILIDELIATSPLHATRALATFTEVTFCRQLLKMQPEFGRLADHSVVTRRRLCGLGYGISSRRYRLRLLNHAAILTRNRRTI